MIDTEILDLLNVMNNRMADINKRLDDVFMNLHNQSTESIEKLTPYTDTKTAYIEDTEIVFEGVAEGNLTVYVKDSEGNYPNYTVERMGDIVKVSFEPLEYVTTVTISIL